MKNDYRKDVEDLITSQNRELFECPYDGKPCERSYELIQCEVWNLSSDDNVETVYVCPRFKKGTR